MNDKKLILTGLIYIPIGIILGAIAAHSLKAHDVSPERIDSFNTAVKYLMYNGIGLLALAGISNKLDFTLRESFRLILLGSILFSGSIIALVLLPLIGINISGILGPITPIGGGILILGWFIILFNFIRTYTR